MDKVKELCALERECEDCKACELYRSRTRLVFAAGDPDAKLMLVGEAPGKSEDLSGLPFSGRSGQLLRKALKETGFDADSELYICNVLKCRPCGNRTPKKSEIRACGKWLSRQMELVAPRIVLCVGATAAAALIDENIRLTEKHGLFIKKDGRLYAASFHPAAVLRKPSLLPLLYADLAAVREKLNYET